MNVEDIVALVGAFVAGFGAVAGWQRWRQGDRRKARLDAIKELEDMLRDCRNDNEGLRDALRDNEELVLDLERRLRRGA